ncbi:hypothetical protein K6W37_14110 [Acetobacter senegalensis]|uniref:hypothetical protein n=1 Tax=Acetobacter senegalensis TaxID=446692 RepID=UPI001ED9E68A|nr:hypothetical protein [Acetobacter senegalensis]MCG4255018.1 hypothetical protein [Acetobacter senegalensis]
MLDNEIGKYCSARMATEAPQVCTIVKEDIKCGAKIFTLYDYRKKFSLIKLPDVGALNYGGVASSTRQF